MAGKTAVLYARYSSRNQREVSIDDQLKVCREYCKNEDIEVIQTYFDKAMTGTNDNRPDFRRMIANAPESNYVVVYKMDGFSRDKYDAPIYKKALEDAKIIDEEGKSSTTARMAGVPGFEPR